MLAAHYAEYGGPDRIDVREVPVPTPQPAEVLVRVLAVSLNASDAEFLRGNPAYTRAWGLLRPKYRTLGSDCAGRVEAVGSGVREFAPGDLVFGDLLGQWGALAEYVVAPAQRWLRIPAGLTPEVAATLPQAGVVAWQAVAAGPVLGKRVLINGAGGGSGTLAVQLAKRSGAQSVVAVDRGEKATALMELGADEVCDFTRRDYTREMGRFDRIIDLVGSRSLGENARALKAGGNYHLVGGSVSRILSVLTLGALRSRLGSQKFRLLMVNSSREAIEQVALACLAGELQPVVGRRFTLSEVRPAFEALCAGAVFGKIVVVPNP